MSGVKKTGKWNGEIGKYQYPQNSNMCVYTIISEYKTRAMYIYFAIISSIAVRDQFLISILVSFPQL